MNVLMIRLLMHSRITLRDSRLCDDQTPTSCSDIAQNMFGAAQAENGCLHLRFPTATGFGNPLSQHKGNQLQLKPGSWVNPECGLSREV